MKKSAPGSIKPARRASAIAGAMLLGLPLAAAFLAALHSGLISHPLVSRYLTHPAQIATFLLFGCALGTLAIKLLYLRKEKAVFGRLPLPPWNGTPLPVSEAATLLTGLRGVSAWMRGTWLGRRVEGLLEFVHQRGSAEDMDDQMRAMADTDALGLEGSYGLTRFITWAMPILGFLGTVLGITQAISGVTPESLETNLGQVTGGLGEAFDSTALALGLTMVTMFLTYLVERAEQSVLERVDLFAEEQLGHRFTRLSPDSQPLVATVQHGTQQLLQATELLVRQQARIWADTLAEVDRRSQEAQAYQQDQLATALESALGRTLAAHAQQLEQTQDQLLEKTSPLAQHLAALGETVRSATREQQAALSHSAGQLQVQAETLSELLEQGKHLVHLQGLLHENLSSLAGAGAFEQAVHSLTAAIHLLTARAIGSGTGPAGPAGRTGAEAEAQAGLAGVTGVGAHAGVRGTLKLMRPGPGSDTGKAA